MQKFSIWTALEVALGVFIAGAFLMIVFKPKKQTSEFSLTDNEDED